MTDLDADAGRNFQGLDARASQEALAEELHATMDMTEENNGADEAEDTVKAAEEAAPTEEKPAEAQQVVREWTPEEAAEHARMVEALLFAAVEPLDISAIAARLPQGADVSGALESLKEKYAGAGVMLSCVANKWRFTTAPDLAHILETERVEPRKLSRAALETLAIIAYHQPCTRADIEDVRGVQVSKGSLDQLLEIGWVRLRGRRRDAPQPVRQQRDRVAPRRQSAHTLRTHAITFWIEDCRISVAPTRRIAGRIRCTSSRNTATRTAYPFCPCSG